MSGLVSLAVADDTKPDVTGTWTWSFQRPNGETMTSTLTLKQDGDKITGTVTGRNKPSDIQDAKLTGDDLTFKVVRTRNDQTITMTYDGKVTADEIKGKISSDMAGNTMSRDWDAKRSTDAATTQPATQPAS
jgi:hypothetical protein